MKLYHRAALLCSVFLGLDLCAVAAQAQTAAPQQVPVPSPLPQPQDIPYPGKMQISVDATDLSRRIMSIKEVVTLPPELSQKGGDFILLYPMWLPGDHSPSGTIDQVGGLEVRSGKEVLPWHRDTVEVSAFHITVPAGTRELNVSYQLLSPVSPDEGRVVMTDVMENIQWSAVSLYPAGYYTRQIPVVSQVILPEGWQYGTALRADGPQKGNTVTFKSVMFNTLVDSPIFAGKYFRKFDLTQGDQVPVTLNVMADKPQYLNATHDQIARHKELVRQATLLFRSHHYKHYDFLLALTEHLGRIGLEHHESSENSGPLGYFTKWDETAAARDLLAHEFTHSWNGKYRRPADLWAANFNTPQRGSGLWVYEGQTQYWGYVLAARSGLMTVPQTEEAIADVAATYSAQAGRKWRPLIDTTNDPIIAQRAPLSWRNWQRSEDYYSEGQLIWLDVDTLIRKLSHGEKSLNNFAGDFFGTNNGRVMPSTYWISEVASTLNSVQPYDWTAFLHQRVDQINPMAPLDGLTRTGAKLAFSDKPTDFIKSDSLLRHTTDFRFSLGFQVNKKGILTNVLWDGPAWNAGITRDQQIIAVNNEAYSEDVLKEAITEAKGKNSQPVVLLLRDGDNFHTVSLPYHDGLRYPYLSGNLTEIKEILSPLEPEKSDIKQ
ncbi:M61 family metallopeptidase [Acetobacter thailandicus]|uniref:M61 family metallopeptidase n=1 Tax=Acetobacter thailandicus TaxID=1502842 RepID=UPI001BAC9734|nr:M61 family metallopeptidase [Acetobacter thailandicus]MBS0986555.1 M61 family metallopeptidase [Acetobacter thailandicus]